jgi:uncharacterized SAM-binding protein YcdF (DUF218 family)
MVDITVARKRFALLAVTVVACLLVCILHIRSAGQTYWYRMDDFAGATLTTESFQIDPPTMAHVASVSYEGDVPVAEIVADEVADGVCLVNAEDSGMMFTVSVKSGKVIVADQINFSGWEYVGWSLAICFSVAFLVCVWNVAWLLKRSWYGHEMAANASAALFCGVQAVIFLQIMTSGQAHDFLDLSYRILLIADRFVWLLLAPMAVAAVLVSLSNLALVRHEGLRPTNLLGIAASIAWAVACLVLRFASGLEFEEYYSLVMSLFLNSFFAAAISFGLCVLAGASLCSWIAAHHMPSKPRDFILILGCALRPDGSPTPLLAGRVDAARRYADAQMAAGQPAPVFVPSGGKGDDERWAEAESMRRYLIEQGVDEWRIIKEDASTNTRENFALSAKAIEASGADPKEARIAFSTTNYHVFRSYTYAHEAGIIAEGIAAPTKLYFWPNAFLREFVGLLAARPKSLALALLAVELVYGLAEYVIITMG